MPVEPKSLLPNPQHPRAGTTDHHNPIVESDVGAAGSGMMDQIPAHTPESALLGLLHTTMSLYTHSFKIKDGEKSMGLIPET